MHCCLCGFKVVAQSAATHTCHARLLFISLLIGRKFDKGPSKKTVSAKKKPAGCQQHLPDICYLLLPRAALFNNYFAPPNMWRVCWGIFYMCLLWCVADSIARPIVNVNELLPKNIHKAIASRRGSSMATFWLACKELSVYLSISQKLHVYYADHNIKSWIWSSLLPCQPNVASRFLWMQNMCWHQLR